MACDDCPIMWQSSMTYFPTLSNVEQTPQHLTCRSKEVEKMQRPNVFSLISFWRVLWLSLLVVMLGGLLESEAAAQAVSFGAKTDFGTDSNPASVAVGDFNCDGKLDLAVANSNAATVSILLGTGTGSFGAKTDFGTGTVPRSVAVGDFNGDGKLDLVVTNGASSTVSILLGTGTCSCGAKTDFVTGICPDSCLLYKSPSPRDCSSSRIP
jgi:hypothetical protein